MNKLMSGMLAATLSVSFAAAAAVPAGAEQIFVPQAPFASSDVQAVDYKPRLNNRNFRGHRNFAGNRGFYRSGNGAYWNGHRGYRDYHRGYRRNGDYWFPLAAFATGALISGAIINNNQNAYRGNSHVQWCYDRYRSYRASDNTFQPNYGPRQECRSPY
jgi:hypothetical protein